MGPDPIKVLIYDDDREQLRMLVRLLTRRGFEVLAVSAPDELVDEACRFAPVVILYDVHMPTTGRGALINDLRAREALKAVKIFLFSASDVEVLRRLARETDADGWLQKTFDGDRLAQQIRDALAHG
jgi:two-component system, OmpR family, response regulator